MKLNAFGLLPEELWIIILEKLADSEDICSMLVACPELSIILKGREFNWRICEVLPLLFPKYLGFKDAKTLRLVSKRWNTAVTTAIVIHPDLVPYNSDRLQNVTSTHFNYSQLPPLRSEFSLMLDSDIQSLWTWSPSQVRNWNPFVSRGLIISAEHIAGMETEGNFPVFPIPKATALLQAFGHQVFHLSFHLGFLNEANMRSTLLLVFQCLRHLYNVKSLKLSGGNRYPGRLSTELVRSLLSRSQFCVPRHLETLDVADFTSTGNKLVHTLCWIYAKNRCPVKKIRMEVSQWTGNLGMWFPSLTELSLKLRPELELFHAILQVLKLIPNLKKLEIESPLFLRDIDLLVLLENIAGLQIECLDLKNVTFQPMLSPDDDPEPFVPRKVPTVQSLRILKLLDQPNLNYDFLKALPSLEDLTIIPARLGNHGTTEFTTDFRLFVKIAVYQNRNVPEGFHLWEELPALKMITVVDAEGRIFHQFARECGNDMFVYREIEGHSYVAEVHNAA